MVFHYLSTLCSSFVNPRLGNGSINQSKKQKVVLKPYAVICSVHSSYDIRQAFKGTKNAIKLLPIELLDLC